MVHVAVSITRGVLCVGVLITRALYLESTLLGLRDFWKLPCMHVHVCTAIVKKVECGICCSCYGDRGMANVLCELRPRSQSVPMLDSS